MKLFVWDFHGVLERGNEQGVLEISNQVLRDYGYKERFTASQNDMLYGRKWYEYFEFLLPHESMDRHLELQEAAFAYDAAHPEVVCRYIRPNDHAQEVLAAVAAQHEQVLISNTKPAALRRFVETVELARFFPSERLLAVDTHNHHTMRSKAHVLAGIVAASCPDGIVIVGDSPLDMALATVAGGVRYHYVHPGRLHQPCESDFRITDLREVLRELA